MTGLAAKRRWINVSKIDQSLNNPSQGTYVKVIPGGYVEGPRMDEMVKNTPYFRETTAHLTLSEIEPLIKKETSVELLRVMATVEHHTGKRDAIIKLFDAQIKSLLEPESSANNKSV